MNVIHSAATALRRLSAPLRRTHFATAESTDVAQIDRALCTPCGDAPTDRRPTRNRLRFAALLSLALVGLPGLAAAQSVDPNHHTPVVKLAPAPASDDTVKTSSDDGDDANQKLWHGFLVDRDFSVGPHAEFGQHDGFAIMEGEATQTLTLQRQHGAWQSETHFSGGLEVQAGSLFGGGSFQPGVAGNARLQVEQEAIRDLRPGLRLHLDGSLGVQGGGGLQFEPDEPISRWDVGGTALVEKDVTHGTVSAGPFINHLRSFDGHGIILQSGAQAGYAHRLSERNSLETDVRVWKNTSNVQANGTYYGTYVYFKHKPQKGPTLQPFIGYEREDQRQMIGGFFLQF